MQDISRHIIEKAVSGDIDAFEEIYKTFSSAVYTAAFNITRNEQDAKEATQDVFINVFRKLRHFKFESSFGTWIYRITVNTAINIYKSRARYRQKTDTVENIEDIADNNVAAGREDIDKEYAATKVTGLLGILSPEHRSCIVLREIEGLDYQEMAEVLKIPLNTVRSRLKRAREALIAYCRKEGLRYGL